MLASYYKLHRNLKLLFGAIGCLIIIGFIFIYSSSSVYALEKFGSSFYFIKKQILYLIPAILSFIVFAILPTFYL